MRGGAHPLARCSALAAHAALCGYDEG